MEYHLVPIINIIAAILNSFAGTLLNYPEKSTVDIVKEAYYPIETHSVVTEDGYILTLHRIPYSKISNSSSKGPVLLMHGLLLSSADWVVLGEKSLAFILSDAGYDVWLGNNRGNTYSRRNIFIDPVLNFKAFFDFSYHEMGKYDLPATIDYILNTTNKVKLPYVGFSEGTTQFWVMMSEKPEYNQKILVANFWAPVTDMFQIQSIPINFLARERAIEDFGDSEGLFELLSHDTVSNKLKAMCKFSDWMCSEFFNLIGSSRSRMPNRDLKAKILENFPAGMSFKQLYHYIQGTRSGIFRPFDYGVTKNFEIYKKPYPDPYIISRVTTPCIMYAGVSDIFVNNGILQNHLIPQMQNATFLTIPYDNFNHLDFIYSTNSDWLLEKTLININKAIRC